MTADRYERHSLIEWFDQDLIRSQRLIVVGAGAVGNEVIKNLTLLGVGEIHVFDKDTIELHNLTRSVLFREQDVGRSKAECAASRATELDANVRIVPHVGDVWHMLDFALLWSASAVFSCVDNFEARIKLSRLCAIAGTPMINVGIDSRFAVVERFPFARAGKVPCYECGLPSSAYVALARRYSCGALRRLAVVERKVPTTILTSSSASSLAVSVYLRALTDGGTTGSRRFFQDTFTGATTISDLDLREDCPGCSDLQDPRIIVRAGRDILVGTAGLFEGFHHSSVRFSDRILTHTRCVACAAAASDRTVFQVADKFDETLATCSACLGHSVEIGLRDEFDLAELMEHYAERPLPGKFIMCTVNGLQVFVELEGV